MDEWVMERYDLAKERVSEIPQETTAAEPYRDFFVREAAFLQKIMNRFQQSEQHWHTDGKN